MVSVEYIEAAKLSAILEFGIHKLKLKGEPLILTRVGGEVFCCIDRCSHEDVPLSLGCIKGDRIKCSYHGSLLLGAAIMLWGLKKADSIAAGGHGEKGD